MDKRMLAATPVLGLGWIMGSMLRAAHRSDLPSFPNQDASGVFGDPSMPPLRIVGLGDSSMTGPGIEKIDNIWIRRIARSHADRHYVELISLAVGGSKAQDVIEGQLAEAVGMAPDIAVVSVGANDAIRGGTVSHYLSNMHQILERLEQASGAIMVVGMGDLGSIPRLPPALRPYLTRRARIFNSAATRVVVGHPTAIKMYTGGRMTSAFRDDLSMWAADQFHGSDDGHRVFAEEAAAAFDLAYRIAMGRREAGTR